MVSGKFLLYGNKVLYVFFIFFFNDTATTEIYTLSLHDALPISGSGPRPQRCACPRRAASPPGDRKSTRLNSSHITISYAVFCLKKKTKKQLGIYIIKYEKRLKKTTVLKEVH